MGNWRGFVARRAFHPTGIDGDVLLRAPGRLWPYWAERQIDPASPAFVARGPLPTLANVTARNWTVVGNLASPWSAIVDPRGLVTPWRGGWSLDWWIGAEDRWHLPSREAAVRQSLPAGVPVPETAMRVPGGDIVQAVYALPASASDAYGELVVAEIENRSPVPVAVAFAVRPYNPDGLSRVDRIALAETTVLVDGRPALFLPRPPSGVAGSTLASGDALHRVSAGQATGGSLDVEDPDGLASAAFVYPLPHRTVVRVAMPLAPDRPSLRLGPVLRRPAPASAPDAARLPGPADVTRGWEAHLRRGLRLQLPDTRLQAAVDANRAHLLLFHRGSGIAPAPWAGAGLPSTGLPSTGPRLGTDAAAMVVTLDRYGFSTEAAEVLRAARTPEAHGAALWAMAEHHRLTGDSALLGELLPAVRDGVRVLAGPVEGLPYGSAFWCVRGLIDGAWLLRLAGELRSAAEAEAAAGRQRDALSASLEAGAARSGRLAMPATPDGRFDARMVGSLVASAPLGLLRPDDPWVVGTLDSVREWFCLGEAFYDPALCGLSPGATLLIAGCELAAGELSAWRRLRWLLDAASATFTWPEAIHPRLGGGCGGDGHHGGVTAAFLDFVRQSLVQESPGGGLALIPTFPPEWAGQPVEVHDAPTRHGRISYALRWHGDRPALLWQCERSGVAVTAPGLDRSFSSAEPSGEALLAPYRTRIPIPVEDAGRP